jgi:hypothetical protein
MNHATRIASAAGIILLSTFGETTLALAAGSSAQVTSIVQSFLPGSSVSVSPATGNGQSGANQLKIELARSEMPSGLTRAKQTVHFEGIGWRANMAASIVYASDPSIIRYEVAAPDGTVPKAAVNDFHGGFEAKDLTVKTPLIDSVSIQKALAQLNSNIAVLSRALPAGSVTSEKAYALRVQGSRNQFALEANITLSSAVDLDGHYGDVLSGLPTGLTGDYSLASVEGLALVVTSSDGTLLVGSWQSTRATGAVLQLGTDAPDVDTFQTTTAFPNLTGGPSTRAVALDAPLAGLHSSGSPLALATIKKTNGGSEDWLLIWSLAAVLALALVIGRRFVARRSTQVS